MESSQNPVDDMGPLNSNSEAAKSPNLLKGQPYTALGHGTIKEEKVLGGLPAPVKILAGIIIFSFSLIAFSLFLPKFLPQKENEPAPAVKPPDTNTVPPASTETNTLKTYTNLENRFSISHPAYVTEGGSAPDPFPVAVELRYNEPTAEFKIGQEKPGWYIRVSKRIAVKNDIDLKSYAVGNRLLATESVFDITLAGASAITWSSVIYPQTFYLLDSGEGIFFIKSSINSQNEAKYQEEIKSILSTLRFLAKPPDSNLGLTWVRRKYGDSWNIEVPDSWQVRDEGLANGFISVTGDYKGGHYQVAFGYPDFSDGPRPGIPASLSAWVLDDLNELNAEQRAKVITSELKVGNTSAQEVFNYSSPGTGQNTHRLYIWKREGRNPSDVEIFQTSGELDSQKMQTLFERFVSGIR